MHFTVAVSVAFALTRDIRIALTIGTLEPFVQTGFFAIHDRVWSRIEAGRARRQRSRPPDLTAHCQTPHPALWWDMHAFETILAVLLGAVLLSLVARKLKAPFPPFLALGGAAVAFLPFAPEMTLDPELVLALFVAPVLLDSSFDSSPRDLKRNIVPITFMTLAAVGSPSSPSPSPPGGWSPRWAGPSPSRWAPSSPRPTPRPRPPSCAPCPSPTASAPSSRARACSTTPVRC
jgi:uncharacterized membrane protein